MSFLPQFLSAAPSGSDSHWRVAGTTSPTLILSSSAGQRSHASIFNDAAGTLYLTFGPGSGVGPTGTFDVKMTSGSYFELPKPIYQGEIWGAWDAAGGFARVLSLGIGG